VTPQHSSEVRKRYIAVIHIERDAWCKGIDGGHGTIRARLLSTPGAKIASMQKHKPRVECIGRVNVECTIMQTAAFNNRYNHPNHQQSQTQEGGTKSKAQASSQGNKAKEQAHGQDDNKAKGEAKSTKASK